MRASERKHIVEKVYSFRFAADSSLKMPAGKVDLTVLMTFTKSASVRVRAQVQAAYVKLNRRGEVADSIVLDDGLVVVDLDSKDRVLGLEMLALKRPEQLPQWRRFARDRAKQSDLVCGLSAIAAAKLWYQLQQGAEVAAKSINSTLQVSGASLTKKQLKSIVPDSLYSDESSWEAESSNPWAHGLALVN